MEVSNRFEVFEVEEEGEEVDEVVEVTVDSGVARSVWPKRRKGVRRQKIVGRKPRLAAANGTNIEVEGEALLDFEMKGWKCCVRFLDEDVKKPLGSVSAMVEEGNTVVFSKKWGSYVENDLTVEHIPLEQKGGAYVMALHMIDGKYDKLKKNGMEINGLGEGGGDGGGGDGGGGGGGVEDMGVFIRRVL